MDGRRMTARERLKKKFEKKNETLADHFEFKAYVAFHFKEKPTMVYETYHLNHVMCSTLKEQVSKHIMEKTVVYTDENNNIFESCTLNNNNNNHYNDNKNNNNNNNLKNSHKNNNKNDDDNYSNLNNDRFYQNSFNSNFNNLTIDDNNNNNNNEDNNKNHDKEDNNNNNNKDGVNNTNSTSNDHKKNNNNNNPTPVLSNGTTNHNEEYNNKFKNKKPIKNNNNKNNNNKKTNNKNNKNNNKYNNDNNNNIDEFLGNDPLQLHIFQWRNLNTGGIEEDLDLFLHPRSDVTHVRVCVLSRWKNFDSAPYQPIKMEYVMKREEWEERLKMDDFIGLQVIASHSKDLFLFVDIIKNSKLSSNVAKLKGLCIYLSVEKLFVWSVEGGLDIVQKKIINENN